MTILKDGDQIQLACDTCSEETPVYDEDEFERMIAAAKADGWQITRPQGEWEHQCSGCSGPGARLAAAKRKFGVK